MIIFSQKSSIYCKKDLGIHERLEFDSFFKTLLKNFTFRVNVENDLYLNIYSYK
jgi:hypothetical protein